MCVHTRTVRIILHTAARAEPLGHKLLAIGRADEWLQVSTFMTLRDEVRLFAFRKCTATGPCLLVDGDSTESTILPRRRQKKSRFCPQHQTVNDRRLRTYRSVTLRARYREYRHHYDLHPCGRRPLYPRQGREPSTSCGEVAAQIEGYESKQHIRLMICLE